MRLKKIFFIVLLPYDLLLLSFHWLKGFVWFLEFVLKEMFDLPKEVNWPYGCLTQKTKSGKSACLPGRKYANYFLFNKLCPDFKYNDCGECHCSMKMYVDHDRWKPSLFRMVVLGFVLLMCWSVPGYCCYLGLKNYLPQKTKNTIRSILFLDNQVQSIGQRPTISTAEKQEAIVFVKKAELLLNEGKHNEAILEYRNAIQKDPENANAYLGRGQCLIENDQKQDALSSFEKACQLDPKLQKGHLKISKILLNRGDVDKAFEHAETVLELNPNSPEAYLLLGKCFAFNGDITSAKNHVDKALSFPIDDPKLFVMAASFYSRINEIHLSETIYKKALAIDPDLIDANTGFAYLHSSQGKFKLARQQLQVIFDKDEKNFKARVCLAEINVLEGNIQRGIDQYKEIGILDDESSELALIRQAELLINFGDSDNGAKILRKILDNNPGNIKANLILANMYLKLRLYSIAIEHVQNVLKKNRKQIHARIILGKSLIGQEKYNDAIEIIESLLDQLPDNLELRLQLAAAYHQTGNKSEAIALCKKAIAQFPHSILPVVSLSNFYREYGNYDEAISSYRNALNNFPENPIVANNLAMLLVGKKETSPEAKLLADKLLEQFPNNPAIADTTGWVYYHEGEFEQAKKLISRSLNLDPNNPVTYLHLGKVLIALTEFNLAEKSLSSALILSRSRPFKGDDEILKLLKDVRKKSE